MHVMYRPKVRQVLSELSLKGPDDEFLLLPILDIGPPGIDPEGQQDRCDDHDPLGNETAP